MSFQHRIKTVYVKELIDILRDRRTLIAMIVVPILLYPLLMLGSIQAVSMQSEGLREEKIRIFAPNESQQQLLARWINEDKDIAGKLKDRSDGRQSQEHDEETGEDLARFELVYYTTSLDPGAARLRIENLIRSRDAQLGVLIETSNEDVPLQQQRHVELIYDPEEIRSATAAYRFRRVIERRAEWIRLNRLEDLQIPPIVIRPFVQEHREVTTRGSILGQILPLILVLMTITGAIYPAIDLTAGERERGTLETLMVCPVPVLDLVVGKFLVVTTVAIMGAALNLASVSATVYFGGFEAVVSAAGDEGFPLGALPLILLSLIPFAILMSAIMIAVCSYARTFKEAQNYVTPVILAVLIPGGIAALPATRLEGVMQVVPVANMVLLTRELLMGGTIDAGAVLLVLLSTSLYAASAVAVAAKVFGTESVVFSDTASLKTTFSRRLTRPSSRPTLSAAALVVAVLFPVWFYVQATVQSGGGFAAALRRTGALMPVFFLLVPLAVCAYFKVDIRRTFALGRPSGRFVLAAVLIGLTAWVPAHELTVGQRAFLPPPEALETSEEVMREALVQMSPWLPLLLLALIPAVSEEALFRGFLLSGLSAAQRKWPAIIASGCIFGVFH
ncbi:MAG: ABC transporter permease subunit/CPBP intramembrane protease, partial [Planctomycetota bacterium]